MLQLSYRCNGQNEVCGSVRLPPISTDYRLNQEGQKGTVLRLRRCSELPRGVDRVQFVAVRGTANSHLRVRRDESLWQVMIAAVQARRQVGPTYEEPLYNRLRVWLDVGHVRSHDPFACSAW